MKKPAVLEQVDTCRTLIFDKTGTLTYGEPALFEITCRLRRSITNDVLKLAASVERYSKHPLAGAVLAAAANTKLALEPVSQISEPPGEGLRGMVAGRSVQITSRKKFLAEHPDAAGDLPTIGAPGSNASSRSTVHLPRSSDFATSRAREGVPFVRHLGPKHRFYRLMLVSGDRESEVEYLARRVGITEVYAGKTPEQKLDIVRAETRNANTLYLGDGINDAPALQAATVGIASGQRSEITAEAAGAVIMDSSLSKVDEFLHIGAPDAPYRTAKRRRRNGAERRRHGVRGGGAALSGCRGDRSGDHRRAGRRQRAAQRRSRRNRSPIFDSHRHR